MSNKDVKRTFLFNCCFHTGHPMGSYNTSLTVKVDNSTVQHSGLCCLLLCLSKLKSVYKTQV